MKNIAKIMSVALLAMFLVAWTSPSEAGPGHKRSGHSTYYKRGSRSHGVHAYQHRYPRQGYYRQGHGIALPHFRPAHYSNFGLFCSPRGTRIQIGFGF